MGWPIFILSTISIQNYNNNYNFKYPSQNYGQKWCDQYQQIPQLLESYILQRDLLLVLHVLLLFRERYHGYA